MRSSCVRLFVCHKSVLLTSDNLCLVEFIGMRHWGQSLLYTIVLLACCKYIGSAVSRELNESYAQCLVWAGSAYRSTAIIYHSLFMFVQDPEVVHAPLPQGQPPCGLMMSSSRDLQLPTPPSACNSPGLDSHEPLIQRATDLSWPTDLYTDPVPIF